MRRLVIDFDKTTLARLVYIVLFAVVVVEHGHNPVLSLWLLVATVTVLGIRTAVRRYRRRTLRQALRLAS